LEECWNCSVLLAKRNVQSIVIAEVMAIVSIGKVGSSNEDTDKLCTLLGFARITIK
jgi:hypothetical protein